VAVKSAGKALPIIVSIVIKDTETGKILRDRERGKVCIKSAPVMSRYHTGLKTPRRSSTMKATSLRTG